MLSDLCSQQGNFYGLVNLPGVSQSARIIGERFSSLKTLEDSKHLYTLTKDPQIGYYLDPHPPTAYHRLVNPS